MLRAKFDEATGEVDSKVLKEIADNEELKAFNQGNGSRCRSSRR